MKSSAYVALPACALSQFSKGVRGPGNRRQVQPHEPGPFDEQEPAKKYEQHEAQVEHHNEVGTQAVVHANSVKKVGGWRK